MDFRLAIKAVGMVTSLGLDWATSCAAARAGIIRAHGLQHYRVQVIDPCDVRPATAHEVELLTRGFEQRGRLVRLLSGALRDLRETVFTRCPEIEADCQELAVYLSLPDENRTALNSALLLEETASEPVAEDTGYPAERDFMAEPSLLEQAAKLADCPWRVRLLAESREGPTGTLRLIEQCYCDIRKGKIQRAMIGAVDSLLDDVTLTWLQKTGRLKTGASPTGLMPGEAAVLFLVEAGNGGSATRALGEFQVTQFAFEPRSLSSAQQSHGAALAGVIHGAGTAASWPEDHNPWIISDHNGESYSAHEWGYTVQRLVSQNNAFGAASFSFPAMAFGDTGTARVAVAVACALAAWDRGYAHDSQCCVVGTSDEGQRAATMAACATAGNR
jgi:3-oxoacyl-[acyl-carrier-protein] synthase I